jgi:hypothetical protein
VNRNLPFDPASSDVGEELPRSATTEQRLTRVEQNQIVNSRKIDENTALTQENTTQLNANSEILVEVKAILDGARFAFKVLTVIGKSAKWLITVAGGFGTLTAIYLWIESHK